MRWIEPWFPFPHRSTGSCYAATNIPDFPIFKTLPKPFHPPVNQVSTTIRTLWKGISKPIWCAESSCSLRLSIASLVVELQAKTLSISDSQNVGTTVWFPMLQSATRIKTPLKGVSGPIRQVESSHSLHFAITPLVVELQPKTSQIPQVRIPPKLFFPPVMPIVPTIRVATEGVSRPFWHV